MLQTNQQADTMQFLTYLQDTHFLLVSVQGHQPSSSVVASQQNNADAGMRPGEKVCCRIPRDVPGPATT